MSVSASFRRAVEYFGGGVDGEYDYDDYGEYDDALAPGEDEPGAARSGAPVRDGRRGERPLALVQAPRTRFLVVTPASFDDARQIADHLRGGGSVVVNVQACDRALAARLNDFCSGLVYALDGSVALVDRGVLLLAPHGVDLTDEAAGRFAETGFFNQT
jgi:cell division inhibitor SepF